MVERQHSFEFTNPQLSTVFLQVLNRDIDDSIEKVISNVSIGTNISDELDNNEATVSLMVNNFKENEDISDRPYVFSVSYTAKFKWEENLEKEVVRSFLNVNAPALLLSYVRAEVASITSNAKVQRLDLPFYDFRNHPDNDN